MDLVHSVDQIKCSIVPISSTILLYTLKYEAGCLLWLVLRGFEEF